MPHIPKISIILPVYNVEPYLDECLKSILDQSFDDFEVIAVNDGSTDRSLEICERYAVQDRRIKVINQINQGVAATRNTGIKAAQGDYVTWIDSDDWVETEYLTILHELATRFQADIAITELTSDEAPISDLTLTEDRITVYDRKTALTALYRNRILRDHFCGKLFRRALFDEIEFPFGRCFEDIFTTFLLFARSAVIVRADIPTYHYIRRHSSITSFNSGMDRKFADWNDALAAQLSFLSENPHLFSDIEEAYSATAINFYRLKRTFLKTAKVRSQRRKDLLKQINTNLKLALSRASARRIGYLRYLNVLRVLSQF